MKRLVLISILAALWPLGGGAAETLDPVVNEAVIAGPVSEVWKAWTTKEGIESWMVAKTDFVLGVGTRWRTNYSADNSLDDETTIHQMTLSYDPERMISFRVVKAPGTFPFPNAILKAWTVVYLEPVDEAHTKVTVRMHGYIDDEESRKMRDFFVWGNKVTLEDLAKRFPPR